MLNQTDTIIALATPPGEGGLAVLRISGTEAKDSLKKFFCPSGHKGELESHHLYHGYLKNADGRDIDEIMAVYMRPPRSYTCEEVVEIHCHGGQQIVKAILDLYLSQGLRLAEPGEFTYRAFINGRLDLTQAEAVARLIHSRSESARALALSQVEGQLSRSIFKFTSKLRHILVLVEAWIDFPEEELPEQQTQSFRVQVTEIIREIDDLLDTFHSGRSLVEGISILLIGRPNAGKSSLLNALLGEERAIVTDIPGTTRDTLEEGLTIGGIPVRLIDTAGFRDSDDLVEMEGVRRAKDKIDSTDLILLLVDGSQSLTDEDRLAYRACSGKDAILVMTKSDLVDEIAEIEFCDLARVDISSKTGQGISLLRDTITNRFSQVGAEIGDSVVISERRHHDSLLRCRESLYRLLVLLGDQTSLEFLAVDLKDALDALGAISGETTPDDILNDIFSSFCIGK